MDKGLREKVTGYRIAMSLVKEMLSRGLVREDEYAVICTILAARFGLGTSTIFSDIDLITADTGGNIGH
jgi:hypothetical protein